MNAITQLETVNVRAGKGHGLRNQQPSSVQEKVQRPSRKGVGESSPKCPAPSLMGEDMVCSAWKLAAAILLMAVMATKAMANIQVTWDVFSDVATAGGVIVETNTMPETNFTITQGTLTITEAGNSVPYSGKLDNLSKFPVMELIQKVLKNDAVKTFDRLAWSQFNSTLLRVVSTNTSGTVSLTTNGTATATNSSAYGNAHAKTIVDTMKERNIPSYLGDDYYALAWPSTLRTFKNNLETIHQYSDTGFKLIMNGEIGRYENVRYVEQTNITKGISTDGINSTSTGTNGAWVNNLSDWIFFFGNDTVAEAIATPEEMRGKIPSDYGRSKGVAWYYLGGFGIVHTLATNCRILKWDSAA